MATMDNKDLLRLLRRQREQKFADSLREYHENRQKQREEIKQNLKQAGVEGLRALYPLLVSDKQMFVELLTGKGGFKERAGRVNFESYGAAFLKYVAAPGVLSCFSPHAAPYAWAGALFLFIASWLAAFRPEPGRAQPEAPPQPEDPLLNILPDPPAAEYERTGQAYASRVPGALAHVGLVPVPDLVRVVEVSDGPSAARIVIALPPGLRLSRLEAAARDLQAAIGAPSLQIQAGPRANTAALIAAHVHRQPVVLKQIVSTQEYQAAREKGGLPVSVGTNEIGEPVITDLARIAHLLVAGSTGSGKSWWLNQLLVSWLLFLGPDRLRLVLVDPKQVELSDYRIFPHVLKIATNADDAVRLLHALVREMEERYRLFQEAGVKNIAGYRQKTKKNIPYIGCIVDELADLVVQAKEEIEPRLQRLAQLARAAGIHLVVATQRPSVDVITGVIKANLPSRIVFRLISGHDYMTVLGFDPGVVLTGQGDGLAMIEGNFGLVRFQSPGIGTNDAQAEETLEKLAKYWHKRGVDPAPCPVFESAWEEGPPPPETGGKGKKKPPGGPGPSSPPRGEEGGNAPPSGDPSNLGGWEEEWEDEDATGPEEDDLVSALKAILAARALSGGEKTVPPAADLARQVCRAKAAVVEVLRQLENEGWITAPVREGGVARRVIIAPEEELRRWYKSP